VAKTLVIAEKPSVGRDLASALPGTFKPGKIGKGEADAVDDAPAPKGRSLSEYLESDDYVITWAVGHLVQLAEPEEYDDKFKKWRMADLPIVPTVGF
jgi:DNA topoisomerase-3